MSEEEKTDQSTDGSQQSTENEAISEPQIINDQPSINMEVHKHPHHVMHKKKWGEYLLEFFMLFLAVFLGFVAENIRESSVEHHKEKEYIESLVRDLKTDTANLSKVIRGYEKQLKQQDTLMQYFDSITGGYNNTFFRLLQSVERYPDFVYTDGTIQQLKSSGSLRLVRSKGAVDSINLYTSEVSKTFLNTDDMGVKLSAIDNAEDDFINYNAIRKATEKGLSVNEMEENKLNFLISHDEAQQSKFFNKVRQFHRVMEIIATKNFMPLRQQAIRLIAFLKKEYHLENE